MTVAQAAGKGTQVAGRARGFYDEKIVAARGRLCKRDFRVWLGVNLIVLRLALLNVLGSFLGTHS